MSENNYESIIYSKNVIEFVTVANEYCSFVENNGRFSRPEFVDRIQKLFPLLYLKASLLPLIDENDIDTPEKFVTEVDYSFLLNKISGKLGQFDSYQEVFDADMQFSEMSLDASIAENICDIYQDLKDFLLSFRIGTNEIMADALYECQNNFATYWGQKLVNGLRALHSLRFGDVDLNEDHQTTDLNNSTDSSWVSKHFNNFFEGED